MLLVLCHTFLSIPSSDILFFQIALHKVSACPCSYSPDNIARFLRRSMAAIVVWRGVSAPGGGWLCGGVGFSAPSFERDSVASSGDVEPALGQ